MTAELRAAFGSGVYSLGLRRSAPRELTPADTGPPATASTSIGPGSRLGDFEILDPIGRGGMGIVFRARQVSLNRTVALKVLSAFGDPGSVAKARFRKEAQAAARLHHTNIVAIYTQGEHEGHYYYVMELIEGESLDVALRRGVLGSAGPSNPDGEAQDTTAIDAPPRCAPTRGARRPPGAPSLRRSRDDFRRIARLMAEVADALDYAHQNGVIHRDIKPQNLLLGRDGRLHIADFGLAHLLQEPHLTATHEIMGTPLYMSPEQIRLGHGKVDWRTDIYSLGATLYEILTLRRPFEGETRDQIIDQVCTCESRPPRAIDPRIPLDLETICLRAIEKNRLRRYQSAAEMAEDLRRFADGRPILSRRTSRLEKAIKWVRRKKALTATIASLVVVVMLGGGLTWLLTVRRHEAGNRLLQQAYDYLAYFNYHEPEPVVRRLDQAERMGADPLRVRLVWALANAAGGNRREAIRDANAVLEKSQGHVEALCIRAIAEHLDNDEPAHRQTLERVRSLGGPRTATEWFFYGLAIHSQNPLEARAAYLQALRLRAAQEHEMYPQAMVHFARALNQLMYRNRDLGELSELGTAEQNLRYLIGAGLYRAYPHYLLSISHRLAAEIYVSHAGPGSLESAQSHYEQALQVARDGQRADRTDDRPVTAEAECLESMDRLADAIEARTRAIQLAESVGNRDDVWEGYHYRWRLCYWESRLDEALADLSGLAQFDPGSVAYVYVYPALVQAEMGNLDRALATTRRIADESPRDAVHVMWAGTCLRILGRTAEADALLADREPAVDYTGGGKEPGEPDWLRRLYACCRAQRTVDDLVRSETDLPGARYHRAEAYFHAAAIELAAGRRSQAEAYLDHAHRCFDNEKRYTYHAKVLLMKLRDPSWPPWIEATSGAAKD